MNAVMMQNEKICHMAFAKVCSLLIEKVALAARIVFIQERFCRYGK